MKLSQHITCERFPCADVRHECFVVPSVEVKPSEISIVMISEAAPREPVDYYYATRNGANGQPLFAETTVQAFNDAGADCRSIQDVLRLGVYLTTAVKCAKTDYAIQTGTVKECSVLLEKELELFSGVKAYLLMGDVAIKSINAIAARAGEGRVIPAGSTYKIRGGEFSFRGAKVFPSYLQAGPSFFIEKSKRKMIAQDIASALSLTKGRGKPSQP